MKTPTQKEIDVEIEKLTTMKPNVIAESFFGDDHHDAIDAQIETLSDPLADADDINQKRDAGELADNVADAAIEALEWMEGDRMDTPSSNWKSLVKKD